MRRIAGSHSAQRHSEWLPIILCSTEETEARPQPARTQTTKLLCNQNLSTCRKKMNTVLVIHLIGTSGPTAHHIPANHQIPNYTCSSLSLASHHQLLPPSHSLPSSYSRAILQGQPTSLEYDGKPMQSQGEKVQLPHGQHQRSGASPSLVLWGNTTQHHATRLPQTMLRNVLEYLKQFIWVLYGTLTVTDSCAFDNKGLIRG